MDAAFVVSFVETFVVVVAVAVAAASPSLFASWLASIHLHEIEIIRSTHQSFSKCAICYQI